MSAEDLARSLALQTPYTYEQVLRVASLAHTLNAYPDLVADLLVQCGPDGAYNALATGMTRVDWHNATHWKESEAYKQTLLGQWDQLAEATANLRREIVRAFPRWLQRLLRMDGEA